MPTILFVDDEPMILRFCRDVLAGLPEFAVLEAASCRDAFDVAARHDGGINLLVCDITMPLMTGIEVAERLTVSRPNMRVLLTSGYSPTDFVFNSAWEFLAKPFRPQDLISRIKGMTTVPIQRCRVSPDRRRFSTVRQGSE